MCVFSPKVELVRKTRIFARRADGARQYLAYSMAYSALSELAMILPLPTPPSSPEDAMRFIDLSGYEEFFDDLERGFLQPPPEPTLGLAERSLEVHDVGSFEASFVPTLADFTRLDERFRLGGDVWAQLPGYADYGFAVFRLKAGARSVHPMAFEFPTRAPAELFFPTVHVHDGKVHPTAQFEHILYCQSASPFRESDITMRHPRSLTQYWLRRADPYDIQTLIQNLDTTPYREWEISWKYPGPRAEIERADPDDWPRTIEKYRAERSNAANYIPGGELVSVERAQGIVDPGLHVLRRELRGTCRNTDVVLTE